MQELLTPPRSGALESNAPRQLSTELPWAKNTGKKWYYSLTHTHKSALHVQNVYAYSQLPTNTHQHGKPPRFTHTHALTHMRTQNVPPALCTDRSENEGTPKQRTGNRGDEFRVRGHRARLIDTLSRGIDRGRAFP